MIRDEIRKDLFKTISNYKIPITKEEIEVRRSENSKFGDFSTNIALKVSSSVIARNEVTKQSKRKIAASSKYSTRNDGENFQSPMEIANILADSMKGLPYIEKLQAVNPGFVNFFIKESVWQEQVKEILEKGRDFGANEIGKGKKTRVEFVSANPTGPLHFGNARGGPIGDVLASVLEFSGYKVLREYYNNNIGGQVHKLGATIAYKLNYFDQAQESKEGKEERELAYLGTYIDELASKVRQKVDQNGGEDLYVMKSTLEIENLCGRFAVELMFDEIKKDAADMGIKFDELINESDIQKKAPKLINLLEEKGFIKEKDGALWFAPNDEFLKDRETVVKKSDGEFTYFASDIVYHKEKFDSGADLIVDIFGSGHHGHIPRLQAVVKALGEDVDKLKFILYQYVRIKKGNQIVKMSKRAGNFITAREVLDEVGVDALRFFILMHDPNTHMDFDLGLAKERSSKNPVYYVQYAHARISSILAKSEIRNPKSEINYELLSTNYELDLIKQISRFPDLVLDIAQNFEVHHLTKYASDLADSFHKFYENCQVLTDDHDMSLARLALVSATQVALANTLGLLGVSAPEKM